MAASLPVRASLFVTLRLDTIGTAPTFDRKELAATTPRSMDNRHLPATSRPPSLVKEGGQLRLLNTPWGFEFDIYPALWPGHEPMVMGDEAGVEAERS